MAYVAGELGKEIQNLMDDSNKKYDDAKYNEAIDLLIKAWDLLPNNKNEYDESFLIVWGILNISIQIKNIDIMNSWVNKIFDADPERGDTGERDMWAGRVAYESGNLDKAKEYLEIAEKKSGGRCFGNKDKKYKDYIKLHHN